ncbi:hypothetical protein [Ancylobacter polymorphus]|uniref:Uncharacterized protein n=1 Tax=Ancylobacter polymorphus TaxID=223390 RepID=A0ABU0BHN0_9HYPH|nr:hypothetical protein [Ancylobacter polymorphus]MDQ0305286.1 hypothetical protein [Ancylobacter polymorphus]
MKWLDRALSAGLMVAFLVAAYGQYRNREEIDGLMVANASLIMALSRAAASAQRSCGGRSL